APNTGPPLPAEAGAPAPQAPVQQQAGQNAPPPATPAQDGQVQQQSAPLYGGTVGPVGSPTEKDQLSQIVGGSATSATELLLGPVARGSEVQITPVPSSAAAAQTGEGRP
ncbi:MAG: mammalian cell entry protein, partial [Mycobacterium sp.]|nr:mammalian cell entry protein [Mycobacterium sp.]